MWFEEYEESALIEYQLRNSHKKLFINRNYNKAAVVIQKWFRGYIERKHLKVLNQMATKIQKCWRGTLVRKRMYSFIIELLLKKHLEKYSSLAVKIQKCWRNRLPEWYTRSKLIEEANETVLLNILSRNDSSETKTYGYTAIVPWLLYTLSKTHHLLRTKCRPGIYSLTDSEELSPIEKILAKLKFKDFMSQIRTERESVLFKLKEKRNELLPQFTRDEKLFYSRYCLQ